MVLVEGGEEPFQHRFLLLGEVAHGVEGVEVAEVVEHGAGIGQALVDIVEIGQQHGAPAPELVEGFVVAGAVVEALVQVADEFDVIGHGEGRVLLHHLADGGVAWAPDGLVGERGKVLVEEERRPLVGEHDGDSRQIVAIFRQEVLGHISQKWLMLHDGCIIAVFLLSLLCF